MSSKIHVPAANVAVVAFAAVDKVAEVSELLSAVPRCVLLVTKSS